MFPSVRDLALSAYSGWFWLSMYVNPSVPASNPVLTTHALSAALLTMAWQKVSAWLLFASNALAPIWWSPSVTSFVFQMYSYGC